MNQSLRVWVGWLASVVVAAIALNAGHAWFGASGTAMAQGQGPGGMGPPGMPGGPGGMPGGGITAVLDRLDELELRLDDIEDLVTPGVETTASICFKLGGEGKIALEGNIRGSGKVEGSLGVDLEGNGITGEAKGEGKADLKAGIEGALGLEFTFCLDIPIPIFEGSVAGSQSSLIAAVQGSGTQVQQQLAGVAAQLGWAPEELQSKVVTALQQLQEFEVSPQPFMLMTDLKGQVLDISHLVPMASSARGNFAQFPDVMPLSLTALNFCSDDFMFEIPPQLQPLTDALCSQGDFVQAKVDAAFSAINAIQNVVQNIQNVVHDIIDFLIPGASAAEGRQGR